MDLMIMSLFSPPPKKKQDVSKTLRHSCGVGVMRKKDKTGATEKADSPSFIVTYPNKGDSDQPKKIYPT